MENGKVIQLEEIKPQPQGLILTPEEKKRLVDFFAVLIEIDRRENVTNIYDSKIISLLAVVITRNDSSRWIDKQKTEIEKSWHQTWWGILILTVVGEIISGLLLYFMGII
jgi:hypothetical protein